MAKKVRLKKALRSNYTKYVGTAQRYLERNPEMRDLYTVRMLAKMLELRAIRRYYSNRD